MSNTPGYEMQLVYKAMSKIMKYDDWSSLVQHEPKLIIKAMQLSEYANIVLRNRYAYYITPTLPIENNERLVFELDNELVDLTQFKEFIDTKAELTDKNIIKVTTLPIVYRIKNQVRNYIYSMITSAIEKMLKDAECWPDYTEETTEIVFVRYSPLPSMCDPDHVEMSTTINAMKDILLYDDNAMYVSFHSLGVTSESSYTEIYLMPTSKYITWHGTFMAEKKGKMQPHILPNTQGRNQIQEHYKPVEVLNIKKLKSSKIDV